MSSTVCGSGSAGVRVSFGATASGIGRDFGLLRVCVFSTGRSDAKTIKFVGERQSTHVVEISPVAQVETDMI